MNSFFRIPDRSLTAYCDPEVLERVAPLHLRFGPDLLRKRETLPAGVRLSESDLLIATKLEHEVDHLHRSLGTSYGLTVHRFHSAQLDAFFKDVASRVKGENVALPLEPGCAPEGHQAMGDFDQLAELLTCSLSRPREVSPEAARRFAEFFPNLDPSVPDSEYSPPGVFSPPLVRYTLGATERMAALGGYALMEYLGLSREIGLRRYAAVTSEGTVELLKATGYQLAGQVWKRLVGQQPEGSKLPSDFYMACELALWIPYGPGGVLTAPSGRRLSWLDFHPGWRFLRITSHLMGQPLFPSSAPLDQAYAEWFSELEAELCGAFDWPTPTQIASEWLSFLEEGVRQGTFGKYFLEDDEERARGSLKLLNWRLEHPAYAAHGYWSAQNCTDLWFSVCSVFDHPDVSGKVRGKLFAMDLEGREFRKAGYRFPPAVSLASALQLFARKQAEVLHGGELKARYQLEGAGASQDVSTYAKRHYGFGVHFGRDAG